MKLLEYLFSKKISIVKFGRKVNIHPSQLSRYINGVNKPSLEQAHRIFVASGRKVNLKDWIDVKNKE